MWMTVPSRAGDATSQMESSQRAWATDTIIPGAARTATHQARHGMLQQIMATPGPRMEARFHQQVLLNMLRAPRMSERM